MMIVRCRLLVLLFIFAFAVSTNAGEWRVLHSEYGARLLSQQPIDDGTAQQLQLPGENAALVLGCCVNFPLVIEDLALTLRLRSNQAGLAIGAQIVLPRTIHPDTQRPVTYIVPGTRYSGSGNWETLGFWDRNGNPNLQRESDRIAALLQAEHRMPFDMRGQYVRQIVLFAEQLPQQGRFNTSEGRQVHVSPPNVVGYFAATVSDTERERHFDPLNYIGFKVSVTALPVFLHSNLDRDTEWISPLERHVAAPFVATPGEHPTERPTVRATYPDGEFVLTSGQDFTPSPAALTHINFNNGILTLDGVPVGVRAIQYRGEPLDFLRRLQFNAVWLDAAPSMELRMEAQRAGIWLICPPPHTSELEPARTFTLGSPQGAAGPSVDSSYDNVLVWNLGNEGSHHRHPSDIERAHTLRVADRLKSRPLLVTARSGVYDYSRTADILMKPRESLFSSLDMLDLQTWQREYQTLTRPGNAFWATVQTQPSPRMTQQWMMFGNPPYMSAVSYSQIKQQVYVALASGARGILFTSHTPLTNDDPETEFRRTALELANWELQLVDEWFASGRALGTKARSNQARIGAAVIQSGRSRLLVPISQERHNQSVIGPAAVGGPIQFTVAGIPETYDAFHLVPGRVLPIRTQRVAGGVQIELDEASLNSLIFFGESGAMNARVGQRATMMGARTAHLAYRLAELELAMTEQVLTALRRTHDMGAIPVHPRDNLPLIAMPEHESTLRGTREIIALAKDLANRTSPDFARSYLLSELATRGLRRYARDIWLEATRHDLHLCMTPVSVSFATLPLYLDAYRRTNGAMLGANRLLGGDMEMRTLEQSGWEALAHRVDGAIVARRDISPVAARSGQSGLVLAVAPENPARPPRQLETVPLWVTTPAMPIRMGEMICVHGWIRIPQPLQSTVDGLIIFDSLGGEVLALRFTDTQGEWREFAFYRIAPQDSNYFVTFALNGFGEVHIDDITVASVQLNVLQPTQPTQPAPQQPPYWQRLNPFQYLPPMPTIPTLPMPNLPTWGQ